MSELVTHLRRNSGLEPTALEAALRRQQIYGGSLDTVLLELELLEPLAVDEALQETTGLPGVPGELLDPSHDRPWDKVPKSLSSIGWALPLASRDGKTLVAVHPDLSDAKRELLIAETPNAELYVTAECILSMLAAQHTGSVIPQRYAVLAQIYSTALRIRPPRPAAQTKPQPRSDEAQAPQPQAPQPQEPQPQAPQPSVTGTIDVERGQAPTDAPTEPSPSVVAASAEAGPSAQAGLPPPPPPGFFTAPEAESKPTPTKAPPQDPEDEPRLPTLNAGAGPHQPQLPPRTASLTLAIGSRHDAATTNLPRVTAGPAKNPLGSTLSGSPTPPAPTVDVHAMQAITDALGRTTQRDEITTLLLDALRLVAGRVALFSVRKDGLVALDLEGQIPDVAGQVIPASAALAAALTGQRPLERATDLDLRLTVRQESAVPCIFSPVAVRGRPVLVLYCDRSGREFEETERQLVDSVAAQASARLEASLLARRRSQTGSEPESAPAPPEQAPPIAPPPKTVRPEPAEPLAPPPAGSGGVPEVPTLTLTKKVTAPPVRDAIPSLVAPQPQPRSETMLGAPPVRVDIPPVRHEPPPATAPASPEGQSPGVPRQAEIGPSGIIPLSTPISSGTTRGRIVLDEEEVGDHPGADLGSQSLEARIDHVIERAVHSNVGVHDLEAFGEPGLLRLAARFPGPLDVLRTGLSNLPPPSAHGPLLRLAISLGTAVGGYLVELMDHRSDNVRFYACFVFQELRDRRCIPGLAERAFDREREIRTIAMRVLETYSRAPEYPAAVARIRSEITGNSDELRRMATRAVGTLRDVDAVPLLFPLLASKDRYLQEGSLEALCSITGQQLGLKPHRWRSWYNEHSFEHRVEWIMSSLSHRDLSVRRWAADELRRITGKAFTFPAGGDKAAREAALATWHDWWDREGRRAFGR